MMFRLLCRFMASYHKRIAEDLALSADDLDDKASHHRMRAAFWACRLEEPANDEYGC